MHDDGRIARPSHSGGKAAETALIYREYTDETLTHRSPIASDWQHLGVLGPVIHAEVGDTIRFVFKNNTPFPASVHPDGVFYAKSSEGAPYDVFTVENENLSPWLQHNINTFATHPGTVDTSDVGFNETNMMHSINGLAYGNLQGQTMRVGQHVRWYLMGMGTEVDRRPRSSADTEQR